MSVAISDPADFERQCRLTFRCADCAREWFETWPIPMNIEAFGKKISGVICPGCAGPNAHLHTEPKKET